jgi:hypothetical protein
VKLIMDAIAFFVNADRMAHPLIAFFDQISMEG